MNQWAPKARWNVRGRHKYIVKAVLFFLGSATNPHYQIILSIIAQTLYICDTAALKAGVCSEAEKGQAIIDTSVASTVQSKVLDFGAEEEEGDQFFFYPIQKTGFYCVKAWPLMVNQKETIFEGHVRFNNHHGALAGSNYPKLPVRMNYLSG